MLVIDASATGALILDDERSPTPAIADQLASSSLVAPAHWPMEVANMILVAERRQRTTERQRPFLLDQVRAMRVLIEYDSEATVWRGGMTLATKHRLTLYDAVYLELAMRRGIALVTLDRDLRGAAAAEGVSVISWDRS